MVGNVGEGLKVFASEVILVPTRKFSGADSELAPAQNVIDDFSIGFYRG
jgi:hypothetical protein